MHYGFYLERDMALLAARKADSGAEKRTADPEPAPRPRYVSLDSRTGRPTPPNSSLKSRAAKRFRTAWHKLTGQPVRHPTNLSNRVRISKPIRSTITSLALASFEELPHLAYPKAPSSDDTTTSVSVDGSIVDRITLPATVASNTSATVSTNPQSIKFITQAPQAHAQVPAQNRSFEQCQLFSDDAVRFASAFFTPGQSLQIWPVPANPHNLDNVRTPPVGAMHRKIRIAPGNMIQIPSMQDTAQSYMVSSHKPFMPLTSGASGADLKLFVSCAGSTKNSIADCQRAFIIQDIPDRL